MIDPDRHEKWTLSVSDFCFKNDFLWEKDKYLNDKNKYLPFEKKSKSKWSCLFFEIAEMYSISYLRFIKIVEVNTVLIRSDIKKATIQNVLDATSVPPFCRLSVQKMFLDLINYNRKKYFYNLIFSYWVSCFTIFCITKTVSVKSITCPVNALSTTGMLTVFSIGLDTFWKVYCISYSWAFYRACGISHLVIHW